MSKYELTARGKGILAVLIVILIGLPTFFIVRAIDFSDTDDSATLSNGTPSDDAYSNTYDNDAEATPAPTPTPTPTPTPPPEEEINEPEYEDLDPPDDYLENDYEDDDEDIEPSYNNEETLQDTPTYGPVNFNPSSGTLSFLFTPALHNSLDDETVRLLGDLLTSPMNTPEHQIVVEFPIISGDSAEVLRTAVEGAFVAHNVDSRNLVFYVSQTHADEQTFEVNLSFQARPGEPATGGEPVAEDGGSK